MELNRARKIGVIYTVIFSILHITLFLILPLQLDGSRDGRAFRRMFWEYIDYIFPFVLLFSWVLGRRFGENFFIHHKSQYWTCYRAIFNVTSLPHWFIVAYHLLSEDFKVVSFNSVLGSTVMSGMLVFAINMFPALVTAALMNVTAKLAKT